MYYAGAGLSQHVWDELEALSIETCGERILMLTGLGSTETAPHALFADKDASRAGLVGFARPRRGTEAGSGGRKARGATPGTKHHARLLAPGRPYARGVR